MRKLFTFLLTMVVTMVANAAITPTVQLGDEFTSVADLAGKSFAIVDKAAEKALFGSTNQNLAFDAYGSAFVTTNSGYTWQLESLAENEDESVHGYYLLHLVAPNGTPVPTSDWEGKYLNSQDKGGWCCFNLGITAKKLGQDIDYGAVWDVQFVEGKGFSLKNIGTGLYKGADGGTANKEEAVYFAFVPVSITYVPALKALLAEGEAMKKRGASSAAYDAAIEGIDPDKSEDALADAQKVEAALPALAMTQLTAGSDFTRVIANFDCGAKGGWTFEKPLGGNGPDHGGDFEYWAGNASNRAEASFDYWQEITGLPNGTYTVSAEMYNSLNNEGGDYTEFKPTVGVYATVGEKTVSKLVDVNSETRVPYVTDVIEVTDGKIRIGAKSFEAPMAARWFTVDNFKLTLVKPAVAPPAPEKDKWYTGADFFRFRADKNATAESPYYAWKEKVEPVWGADPDDVSNGCIVCNVPANVDPKSQIWMRGTEAGKTIAKGSKDGFRVTFRVKADGEYTLESQAHNNWGYKTGLNPFGPLNVTTEWQTVSFVCTGEKAKEDFTDLCFNLSGDAERTIYFDDVQIVRGDEGVIGSESVVKVYNNVWSKGSDINALIKSDDKGNYIEVVSPAKAEEDWDSQIFISIPEEFVGKQVTLTMDVKASAETSAAAQLHKSNDGEGYTSAPAGDAVPFTTEWATISRTLDTSSREVSTWWGGKELLPNTNTYVLNLTKEAEMTYGFKNITFAQAQEDWYTATTPTARTYEGFTEEFVMADGEKVPYKNSWEADGTTHTYNDGVSIKYTKTLPEFAALPFDFKDSCIKIKSNDMPINDYDCQFFIKVSDKPLKKNQIVTVSMKVKTDSETEVTVGTGVHHKVDGWTPNASDALTFKVSADWQDIVGKFDVTHEDLIEGTGKGGVWYALSLSDQKAEKAHNYWFDDITVKIEDAPVLAWEDLIPLQDFEAGYTGAEDEPIYFLSKENVIAADDTHRSRIVEGAGKDSKNGIEFRTVGGSAKWDSQFEIRFPYQLPNGTTYKLEFDYKVDATANFDTQSWDGGVGSYASGGTAAMKVSEEEIGTWKHYSEEYKVNYTRKDGDNVVNEGLRWDVFDMAQSDQPNAIVFIDNISVQVPVGTLPFKDAEGKEIAPDYLSATEYPIYEYVDPTTLDWSENILKNGDLSTNDMSEFILKNNDVENPEMLLAEKNEYGEIGIETAALPAEGGNDYDAQFFVRLPKVLPKGKKFNLEFDLYAEHINTLTIAAHGEPGEWKANISSVKTDPSLDAVHYQEYLTAPADMRTIAFNLAVADATTYGFSNIKVQYVNDDKAAIEEATQTADATTLWAETLALNEACYAGRITETEGYTAESVKTLTDAIAAGKAALAPAEGDPAPTKESLTAAAQAITDAIAGLKKDAPALAYTDLTKEMFFHWNAADETAEPIEASNCDFNIGTSTGQPYGLSTVNHDRFADLSAYNTIELTATEGEPRLLFNRIENEGTVFAEVPRDKDKYETVVDNGDGSKTYVIDIAAIVAEYGFAHLHAIKGANWANTTVTEIKLGYAGEKPALPIPTAIEGVETAEDALQDGKYFINGQIVIVKNGVKYNAAGVAIK